MAERGATPEAGETMDVAGLTSTMTASTKELRVRLKRLKSSTLNRLVNGDIIREVVEASIIGDGSRSGSISGDDDGDDITFHEADDSAASSISGDPVCSMVVANAKTVKMLEASTSQFAACAHAIESHYHDDMDEVEIGKILPTILTLPPFDAYEPTPQRDIIYKPVVSLMQLSLRDDNVIEVVVNKQLLAEGRLLRPITMDFVLQDLANIFVKHETDEFFTFCSCKSCLEYRETIMHIMMDQFKAAHMVVMLLDVLIKAYSPMLKNDSAYNKFEKLLESNKEIYWITSGYLYDKNAEYLDFIDDSTISDNMILVLFSSILMVNNPMLLLQILAYNVECIVKAFSEGIIEIAQTEHDKIPAEKMLTYVLDGYSDLNCVSQKISLSLFAFESDFLREFKLTWVTLCQRLFQQHVYAHLADTMLACIITLKEEELTPHNASLIKRYILFDEHMNSIERRWTEIWLELNNFNLSEVERKRRLSLLDVHHIFDTVVLDATAFSLPDISDDEFTDFQHIEDRHLAWKNIMAFTKLKWPDGFNDPPNTLVFRDTCLNCNASLEYHYENCKCITCSIAGGPLPPRNANGTCAKCTSAAHTFVEKDPKLMKSKILSACSFDDPISIPSRNATTTPAQRKSIVSEDFTEEISTMAFYKRGEAEALRATYHIAWAVFQHLTTRKRYRHDVIDPQNFCGDGCRVSACLLARKILNNEVSPKWTKLLLRHFQPLSFTRDELRATMPSLMFFNRKMLVCEAELRERKPQNYIYKTYWTFILSIYANFFMRFNYPSCTILKYFHIVNKDLRLKSDDIVGNDEDKTFEEFLSYTKRLSPYKEGDDIQLMSDDLMQMQQSVEKLMSTHDAQIIKRARSDVVNNQKSSESPPIASTSSGIDSSGKKNCKDKIKKCCLDYPDMGEHCKENHAKKRVKKECNHARYNETRDRLRKKFAQIVNERKNKFPEAGGISKAATTGAVVNAEKQTTNASCSKQPPTLKSVASAAASAKVQPNITPESCDNKSVPDDDEEDNSLTCLDSLCKSIQLGKTHSHNAAKGASVSKIPSAQFDSGRNHVRSKDKELEKAMASLNISNSIGMVNEFYEFIDTFTKEQDKRWINETLNFIEGTSKQQQPQTVNPKKAAKKAKQKQRKEEEKRITELHDLRGQFHDIYFKEFVDKQELKTHMSSSKKRDKKRISELEANIKKLQRAKAKVEIAILELIATVKQTNSEFKFTYLPTKEQQQQKMREMEEDDSANIATVPSHTNNVETNYTESFSVPYESHFPSHMMPFTEFRPDSAYCIAPQYRLPTPVCYAPPQQQPHLRPDVVAVMKQNVNTADPSQRIVTIKRVQTHDANEPQVTISAKGNTPDDDKLLYTFVNGQLVAPPAVATHMSMPTTSAAISKAQAKFEAKRAELNKLSKVCLQVASETTATFKKVQLKGEVKQADSNKLSKINKKTTDLPSAVAGAQQASKLTKPETKQQTKTKNKTQKTTVLGTNANTQAASSSVTTCSSTTSKSETPIGSEIHTRENSICSLKQLQANGNTSKKQNKQGKKQQQQQQQQQQQIQHSQNPTQKHTNKTKSIEKPMNIESVHEPLPATGEKYISQKREKRQKLIDAGQFDNNPFKSLHMQDSSDDEYESGTDSTQSMPTAKVIQRAAQPSVENAISKNISTNSEQTALAKTSKATNTDKKLTTQPEPSKTNTVKERKKEAQNTSTQASNSTNLNTNSNRKQKHESAGTKSLEQKQTQQHFTSATQQQSQKQSNNATSIKKSVTTQTKSAALAPTSQRQPLPVKNNSSKSSLQSEAAKITTATNINNNNKQTQQSHVHSSTGSTQIKSQSVQQQQQQQQQPERQQKTTRSRRSGQRATPVNSVYSSSSAGEQQAPLSKRSQRSNRRYQKQKLDCSSGIPNNMGYFDPNEVACPPPNIATTHCPTQSIHAQHQSHGYGNNLNHQMQHLRLGNSIGNASNNKHASSAASNVSIMDQLNRGVQVEHLSLPPGITLTKVDPIKSEQLRQKTESIRKLAQPLPTAARSPPPTVHRLPYQTASQQIPIAAASYYGSAYNPSGMDSSGIIMVEANPKHDHQHQQQHAMPNVAAAAAAATASGKSSSRRRRRRKNNNSSNNAQASNLASNKTSSERERERDTVPSEGKMITLRNPMFHANASVGGTAAVIQHNPMLPGRSYGGLPLTATLPVDQPAAIIKNDNGMFTIRNPMLHQAVTNGLALGGYRQFNYYTPQEAAAEAARANQQQMMQEQQAANDALPTSNSSNGSSHVPTSFSYFSSGMACGGSSVATNSPHNNISISHSTNLNTATLTNSSQVGTRLTGDAAVIARPKPTQKCISAIGSEIKQKTKECSQQWPLNYGPEYAAPNDFASATNLQEKYQQSNYYNGFDVFTGAQSASSSGAVGGVVSGGGALFDAGDCRHLHHSCGDDSPPPTITGFNSYLEGIPNTGVIRYDDASFLKNLIPGQHLNNEVSIHNISDSNFSQRSTSSTSPHHVEITNVYSGCTNSYEQQPTAQQKTNANTGANYCDNVNDYASEAHLFSQANSLLGGIQDIKDRYGYTTVPSSATKTATASVESQQQQQQQLNELLRRSPHSQRTSPYSIDEGVALENFVQSMNALQIGASATATATSNDVEQGSKHLNGKVAGSTPNVTDTVKTTGDGATVGNGWW